MTSAATAGPIQTMRISRAKIGMVCGVDVVRREVSVMLMAQSFRFNWF
ncbi:hypothetical protein N182_29955 [Sinorhizobium sp. GL2]|nr:hypothetical protein N182_29955 [Sinorhizobium sp. GL2]